MGRLTHKKSNLRFKQKVLKQLLSTFREEQYFYLCVAHGLTALHHELVKRNQGRIKIHNLVVRRKEKGTRNDRARIIIDLPALLENEEISDHVHEFARLAHTMQFKEEIAEEDFQNYIRFIQNLKNHL